MEQKIEGIDIIAYIHDPKDMLQLMKFVATSVEDAFKNDLFRLKIRRSYENLQSLQNLSLKCICDNIRFFQSKHEPFSGLPSSVLSRLVDHLTKLGLMSRPELYSKVVTARTQSLSLDLTTNIRRGQIIWCMDALELIIDDLVEKCANNLKTLKLRLASQASGLNLYETPRVCINKVNSLISAFSGLQQLSLRDCGIHDNTLATIGSVCRDIRELRLDWNNAVTDKGVELLCMRDPGNERCKLLSCLTLQGTKVSYRGLLVAIQNLHFLLKLKHHDLDTAVEIFHGKYDCRQLKLEHLCISDDSKVDIICKTMPEIKTLNISGIPVLLSPILTLKNLTKLSFCNSQIDSKDFQSIITHVHQKLLVLKVECCKFETDISHVGFFCLKLETFKIFSPIVLSYTYKLNFDEHFTNLKVVEMSGHGVLYIPDITFGVLLASPRLKSIALHDMFLPCSVFDNLVAKARAHEKVFSNLERISFQHCAHVSILCLTKVYCVAPKLNEINGLELDSLFID